jgi:hypothetical protein
MAISANVSGRMRRGTSDANCPRLAYEMDYAIAASAAERQQGNAKQRAERDPRQRNGDRGKHAAEQKCYKPGSGADYIAQDRQHAGQYR